MSLVIPGMWIPGRKWYVDQHTLASPKESREEWTRDLRREHDECSLCWDGIMYIFLLHFYVVGWWIMFTGIVSMIELAFCPEKTESCCAR